MNKPLIGIVLDWEPHGSFSPYPHYALRDNYFSAVIDAGGIPVGLPLLEGDMDIYLNLVQGVILPGGDYPSPSRWYGDGHGIPDEHPRSIVNEDLVRKLLSKNVPFLAICAGLQEMVAATGGLLWWRVKESLPHALDHRSIPLVQSAHEIQVQEGTLLARTVKTSSLQVNSHHSEGVRTLGQGLQVCAIAPDGLIEAAEAPNKTFAIGVQWHPEFGLTQADHDLFVGLVEAAKMYRKA